MRWMTKGLVALALMAAGCSDKAPPSAASRAGGSVTLSANDERLLIADADNDELIVVDVARDTVAGRVKVGRGPRRVLVGADGRAFVSNQQDRSVSVVDVAGLSEVTRIAVGAEPTGLALTPDGTRLLVANSMSQSVSIVDLATLSEIRQVKTLGGDPQGLAALADGRVLVTYVRNDKVSVLDVSQASLSTRMSLTMAPEQTGFETRIPGQAVDPVVDVDGERVYVPHVQSKEDPVPTDIGSRDSYAGSFGSIPVVASAVATVDPVSMAIVETPRASEQSNCMNCDLAMPGPGGSFSPAFLVANGPLSGPVAAALQPGGEWLFVVNQHSNNVSIVPTRGQALQLPPVSVMGAGPNGIAVSALGDVAYVYSAFDHVVSVLGAGSDGAITTLRSFKVGSTPLTAEQQLGRKLFFSADDTRMTNPAAGGIACASCHPGGREDGRTWQFSEGPRNTPTLAGRGLARTAPYHWDGLLTDMHAFKMVVETRMGGSGTLGSSALTATDFNAMLAFLETLPRPDNPNRGATPTDGQLRGRAIFERPDVKCATCHKGEDLTDNLFNHVGTEVMNNPRGNPDTFPNGVDTPPLHNLFATAPYLHDGSIATLRDRVTKNPRDLHGVTSHLSDAEIADLVEYLESL